MIDSEDGISDDEIISSNNIMVDLTLPVPDFNQKPNFNSTLFPNQGNSSTPSNSQPKMKSRLQQLQEEEDVEMLSNSVENMSIDLVESDNESNDQSNSDLVIHESFKKKTTIEMINSSSSNQVPPKIANTRTI